MPKRKQRHGFRMLHMERKRKTAASTAEPRPLPRNYRSMDQFSPEELAVLQQKLQRWVHEGLGMTPWVPMSAEKLAQM